MRIINQGPNVKETRLKWTEKVKENLLDCKRKAKVMVASDNPPRNLNGKMKGYMQTMKELWDETDRAGLNLTSQNLRDQAARLEETFGNVRETICERENRTFVQTQEGNENSDNFRMIVEFQEPELPIESPKSQIPEEHPYTAIDTEKSKIAQESLTIFNEVMVTPGTLA